MPHVHASRAPTSRARLTCMCASHVRLTRASSIHATHLHARAPARPLGACTRVNAYAPHARLVITLKGTRARLICTSPVHPTRAPSIHAFTPRWHPPEVPNTCSRSTPFCSPLRPSQALSKGLFLAPFLAPFWPQKWPHFGLILARAFSQNPCNHWTLETLCLQGFDDASPANRCNHWIP